jgi:hypothetical protein
MGADHRRMTNQPYNDELCIWRLVGKAQHRLSCLGRTVGESAKHSTVVEKGPDFRSGRSVPGKPNKTDNCETSRFRIANVNWGPLFLLPLGR